MPSSSKKQADFMRAIAHSPAFAKKVGVPQSVGRDFSAADKGRKFAKGGDTMAKKMFPFMGKETKAEEAKEMKVKAKSPAMYRKGEKAEGVHGKSGMEKPTKYARGGGIETKGKTKAQKFADGGPMGGMDYAGAPAGGPGMSPEMLARLVGGTGASGITPEVIARMRATNAGQGGLGGSEMLRRLMAPKGAPIAPAAPMRRGAPARFGREQAYAKGGSVDGCAVKGKTRGKVI